MSLRTDTREVLVALLKEAAQLEHGLLNAYLYTACSLKSLPEEFAELSGEENRRRAIHFERVRDWKLGILNVAHEEMLHLHYVQCLLRALGEPPCFDLPPRDPKTGHWVINDWRSGAGADLSGESGVSIPIERLTWDNIHRFILYEASSSLQRDSPFNEKVTKVFERLYRFELDLLLARTMKRVQPPELRDRLEQKIREFFVSLAPVSKTELDVQSTPSQPPADPDSPEVTFHSIADLYLEGVLPLYGAAFDKGLVTHSNLDLNNEQLDPNFALAGFLPIGPVYRGKNFDTFAFSNLTNPLIHYRDVGKIIGEIVEEGEGASNVIDRAEQFLAQVEQAGGARAYAEAVEKDKDNEFKTQLGQTTEETPEWVTHGELLRESHLYRFALVMREFAEEIHLTQPHGVRFEPSRAGLPLEDSQVLKALTKDLPRNFNACYLVLVSWLSRMYEIPNWEQDKPRRQAIEMLATWPLMSMAIRPFLELASFFPVDPTELFRWDAAHLPILPLHARQLSEVYTGTSRSQEINAEMDDLAVRALGDVAVWAKRQLKELKDEPLPKHARPMIESRLRELALLSEFQTQFDFRVHGGYSDRMPDMTYQQANPGAERFEENPQGVSPVFKDSLVLRLRFSGWGLSQLATDPDPMFDEAGCSGDIMLHASDESRILNRALIWQTEGRKDAILRRPRSSLPEIGVNCVDATLLVTDGAATAGYVPVPSMSASGSASGPVKKTLRVDGLNELLTLKSDELVDGDRRIRVDLESRDGMVPQYVGLNHIVWQDGEAVDPFILTVSVDPETEVDDQTLLYRREVFAEGSETGDWHAFLRMSPLQRLKSSRAPTGLDHINNMADWVKDLFPEEQRAKLADMDFPNSYLDQRAAVLSSALEEEIERADESREGVDSVISLTRRLMRVSNPQIMSVVWLRFWLRYGHTLSGPMSLGEGKDPILDAVAKATNLGLRPVPNPDRTKPNGRWLTRYTLGVMDTDAVSNVVALELYIPLEVAVQKGESIRLERAWTFPEGMRSAVADFACRFARPFWGSYEVDGDTRTTLTAGKSTVTETRIKQGDWSYKYSLSGIEGLGKAKCRLRVGKSDGLVELKWSVKYTTSNANVVVTMATLVGAVAREMEDALTSHFSPDST